MITAKVICKIYTLPADEKPYRLAFAIGDLVICEIYINAEQYNKLQAIGIPEIKK